MQLWDSLLHNISYNSLLNCLLSILFERLRKSHDPCEYGGMQEQSKTNIGRLISLSSIPLMMGVFKLFV